MDWDHVRFFLAITREGSLRAAGRQLGVDQATAGRRLAALERQLGAKLFAHTPTGYLLTEAGQALLVNAERMEQEAQAIERRTRGLDAQLAGTVRLSMPDRFMETRIAPALARLHERYPDVRLMLWIERDHAGGIDHPISTYQADIGIRMRRPALSGLITRRLGPITAGLYAAKSYIAERGVPVRGTWFLGHDLILLYGAGRDRETELCDEPITNGRVVLEANTDLAVLSAASSGLGVALLSPDLAAREPQLVRLWPEHEQEMDVWLVVHPDVYKAARVRVVMDALIEAFADEVRLPRARERVPAR
ncbi:MAG TPA: LysR family transcriptional regulator [Stellaceae bacterium]|nr:LysR family transcriptional regulator [Stellaceae bacterium]